MTSQQVLEIFQPRFGDLGQLVVAGGAVRDELMGRTPKDFDLFLLWATVWDFKTAKEMMLPRLGGLTQTPPRLEFHRSEPYLVADVAIDGADIQILCNPAQTPEALVDTFDWSVCLFARTDGGLIQRTPLDDIGPGKELKLQKVTFPLSTLRRGFRFSERFKMKLRYEDALSLCQQIASNAAANNHVSPIGNEPDMASLAANVLVEELQS